MKPFAVPRACTAKRGIGVPTQVGTLTQVVTSVHLGRPTGTPIFLLTHLMPFSTQLGTQCFKIRLGMVCLLSAVKIKSNTRVIFKKPEFKQTIYQVPSMTLKLLAMLSRITWTAEFGACPPLFE